MGCTDVIFLADTAVESTKLANSSISTFHFVLIQFSFSASEANKYSFFKKHLTSLFKYTTQQIKISC